MACILVGMALMFGVAAFGFSFGWVALLAAWLSPCVVFLAMWGISAAAARLQPLPRRPFIRQFQG